MEKPLTLLHTATVHRATFSKLAEQIAPNLELVQHVHKDWLTRARENSVDSALHAEISELVQSADGPVVCTCTTLGAVAEELGAIRIDRPMMSAAARRGGKVLMVFCLESTRTPSTELLEQEIEASDSDATIIPMFLEQFWPLFEAGENEAFLACIAGAVNAYVVDHPDTNTVVLAQASMAGASALLSQLKMPVLTSPEIALQAFA